MEKRLSKIKNYACIRDAISKASEDILNTETEVNSIEDRKLRDVYVKLSSSLEQIDYLIKKEEELILADPILKLGKLIHKKGKIQWKSL